ncbi:mucosa-associated lymphoid tissue lymphoma translocation protein 1 isoform X4 [Rattus norvegicus]|nr:mucosa-associated lymphoid tissue lymphoma translocation protein 1 isoform X5 [Rattus norvegicus]
MSLWGQPLQASPPPAVQQPLTASSGPSTAPPAGSTLNRLPEPLLRRLSESLDRAPEGRGWRQLAELAGSRGRLRLSCLDLEQCSLKVLEPEGSPSLCLLKLMGEKGCTVPELSDFLQALEHTEVLQLLNPPGLKITVNPESKAVLAGQFVKLCCRATGHPFVQYQWFKMNKEIPYGNSSELIFNTVHVKDAGFYVCRVNNNSTFEFSQWSQLDVCDVTEVSDSFQGSLDGVSESKLRICVEPQSQKLAPGSALLLQCVAIGSPVPHYQWFKDESPLAHETKKHYTVPYVDLEHEGTYWCHVYNDRDSQDSKKVEIIIGRTDGAVECTEDELNNLGRPDNKEQTGQPLAKDKVALLIGNMNYWEHPKLKAPLVDVYELTNLLRQLDFKVVSLLDLTEYEMCNAVDEFLLLLDKGVYGWLHYILKYCDYPKPQTHLH